MFVPGDRKLAAGLTSLDRCRLDADGAGQRLKGEIDAARGTYESRDQEYRATQQRANSTIGKLLSSGWEQMRDLDFEYFLRDVFQSLGCVVEMTPQSGDQGADLIVTGFNKKICVQAKGWSKSVGNSAVQEAHSGKGYYNCTHAIVMTNSRFTRKARDLASKLKVTLIDVDPIPLLIQGRWKP